MFAEVQQVVESFDPIPWVCGAIVGATVLNFIFRGPPTDKSEQIAKRSQDDTNEQ